MSWSWIEGTRRSRSDKKARRDARGGPWCLRPCVAAYFFLSSLPADFFLSSFAPSFFSPACGGRRPAAAASAVAAAAAVFLGLGLRARHHRRGDDRVGLAAGDDVDTLPAA